MNRTIAIVGAGYAGALTAVQVLRQCTTPGVHVVLLEREPPFARGLAYRSWDESQLLNVPAGNMSALAQEADHFAQYCRGVDPALHAGSFVSRRIYGDYLEDTLREAQGRAVATLEARRGDVRAVRPQAGGFDIELAGGTILRADRVVLAFGHFPPGDPLPGMREALGAAYLPNPWDIAALDRCDHGRPIVLVGSGHTAIDVLLRLASRGDAQDILLLSRHGLLPHGHRPSPQAPHAMPLPPYVAQALAAPPSLRALVRAVRAEAQARLGAGGDWRDVLNEMRPHLPAVWQRMDVPERRRFLERIVPFWDIHRHRLAPSVSLRLQRMLRAGQVRQLAARLVRWAPAKEGVRLELRERHTGTLRALEAGTVVNCTGPTYDLARVRAPLVEQLLAAGLLRPDPLRLGMEIDERYRVRDRRGASVPGLHYIGPMLKATFWEAIAVPELRGHAQRLAAQLLGTD